MKQKSRKIAGRTLPEWEALSAELDEPMAGSPENTRPLSPEEKRWLRRAVADTDAAQVAVPRSKRTGGKHARHES